MTAYETAVAAAKAIDGKKGLNIQVIEIGDVSVIADYMVIATGNSSTHVKALADEVEYQLDKAGVSVSHIEGYRDLDRLWQDGKPVDLTDIITD